MYLLPPWRRSAARWRALILEPLVKRVPPDEADEADDADDADEPERWLSVSAARAGGAGAPEASVRSASSVSADDDATDSVLLPDGGLETARSAGMAPVAGTWAAPVALRLPVREPEPPDD